MIIIIDFLFYLYSTLVYIGYLSIYNNYLLCYTKQSTCVKLTSNKKHLKLFLKIFKNTTKD